MSIENTGLKTKLDLAVSRLDNMQPETTGLKTQSDLAVSWMDNMQLENTGLKTKLLDLAVSRMDDLKAENTRLETKLDLAGYRMDEMQNTIYNSASVNTGIDGRIKAIQEEADKRLRGVARMLVLVDHDDIKSGKLTTDDYYGDFAGGTGQLIPESTVYSRHITVDRYITPHHQPACQRCIRALHGQEQASDPGQISPSNIGIATTK
ncbi:hypothetical protein BGZ89_011811 [Linnemannia elongata]|nr:hypothetical protein BGZ89_011811 [Linnemannia elongata]